MSQNYLDLNQASIPLFKAVNKFAKYPIYSYQETRASLENIFDIFIQSINENTACADHFPEEDTPVLIVLKSLYANTPELIHAENLRHYLTLSITRETELKSLVDWFGAHRRRGTIFCYPEDSIFVSPKAPENWKRLFEQVNYVEQLIDQVGITTRVFAKIILEQMVRPALINFLPAEVELEPALDSVHQTDIALPILSPKYQEWAARTHSLETVEIESVDQLLSSLANEEAHVEEAGTNIESDETDVAEEVKEHLETLSVLFMEDSLLYTINGKERTVKKEDTEYDYLDSTFRFIQGSLFGNKDEPSFIAALRPENEEETLSIAIHEHAPAVFFYDSETTGEIRLGLNQIVLAQSPQANAVDSQVTDKPETKEA